MVLIFSTPKVSQAASNVENRSLRSATSCAGCQPARDGGEAHEVAEHDGDPVVAVGDESFARVQAVDDRLGQHVEQQLVRPGAFGFQLQHQPVQQPGVRVADLLQLGERLLELSDTAVRPELFLAQALELVGRSTAAPAAD